MNFKIFLYKLKLAIFRYINTPFQNTTYSQAGEDSVIRFLLNDKKITNFTYLDIGTNIPNYGNNTFLFYKNRTKGVCVEADISLIPVIKKTRPNDVVLNYGVVTDAQKEADFFIFNEPGINTFDKIEAEKRQISGNYKLVRKVKVPLVNINELISKNFNTYPTIISLDIEGLDLTVLKSLDFAKYPIPILIVETCLYSENHIRPNDNEISNFILGHDYFEYATTYINTIFVNKTWFNIKDV